MALLNSTILSWILLAPLLGALLLLLVRGDRLVRWTALIFTLATFVLSLHLPVHFVSGAQGFQFEQQHAWIPALHIGYHVGIDGLSLWLVPLTTLLTLIALLVSWGRNVNGRAAGIQSHVKIFHILLLLLEAGMVGVFVSLDLFLFYLCWEAMLIPMILILGGWGHERRVKAAVQFFLFTMLGSVLMLGSILWLYHLTGSFDFIAIRQALSSGAVHLSSGAAAVLFLGFFLAFAIKIPIVPFHGWQPLAYTEASAGGSILLAGVLSKMGAYGLLRFNLAFFPQAAHRFAPAIIVLALIGIIYGALVAYAQTDLKRLVAYSSLSHMSFVVLGIFTFTNLGYQGAVFQMIAHGIAIGGLFALLGIAWDRKQTYDVSAYGGLATGMPIYAGLFVLLAMAAAGLPLLSGFPGEFLILLGAFSARHIYGIVAAVAVILTALYMLDWTRKILWGEASAKSETIDADGRERLALGTLAAMALLLGIVPHLFLRDIAPAPGVVLAAAPTQPRPSGAAAPAGTAGTPGGANAGALRSVGATSGVRGKAEAQPPQQPKSARRAGARLRPPLSTHPSAAKGGAAATAAGGAR